MLSRVWVFVVVLVSTPGLAFAQNPPPSPASKPPTTTVTQQTYSAEQIESGRSRFAAQCGFCHGRDAAGGENGSDLTRATLVAGDVRGDKIGPAVRQGRPEKGMPPFSLSDDEMMAIVAFIHDAKALAAKPGGRRRVDPLDLNTGNADEGRRYFNGAGGCATCHQVTGTFATVGSRYEGLALLQRMLYPGSGSGAGPAPAPAPVTVTTRDGRTVTGTLVHRDEFAITIRDQDGWTRSWTIAGPAVRGPGLSPADFSVADPLRSHVEQLAKYTDRDMHNVLAYLQSLR